MDSQRSGIAHPSGREDPSWLHRRSPRINAPIPSANRDAIRLPEIKPCLNFLNYLPPRDFT
ncbi:hypothetical protein [Phormidium pseudopriestleyi]|uniref:hypothetical protein n=1 Tax=Phormidium pseudopriestleyi TaxID=1759527 RepID=UPI001A8F619C|nr:hypothetical protein [Phormidium pseudopriestleyi]